MRKWIVLAALLLVSQAARAADIAHTGPQASAADIVQAHGTSPEAVLHISYETGEGTALAPATADIGSSFIHFTIPDSKSHLLDYKLRRRLVIDTARRTFANTSLFTIVDFRNIESFNRRMQRKMLAKIGAMQDMLDQTNAFWNQQELQIVVDPDDGRARCARRTDGDSVVFEADGREAVRYALSDTALSPDEMKNFAHFMRESMQLHPLVVDEIVAAGRLPSRVAWIVILGGRERSQTWILKSVTRAEVPYPLDASYKAQFSDLQDFAPVLTLMLNAVAGRAAGGPRTPESYRAAIDAAIAKGAIIDSYILEIELFLHYGRGTMACAAKMPSEKDCAQADAILAKWNADAATDALRETFQTELTDPRKAVEVRLGLAPRASVDTYMFDLWNGNVFTTAGRPGDGRELILKALRANPYVASFYKDLGDTYRRDFMPVEAWLCYDLGRALPTGPNVPIIDKVVDIEAELLKRYPQFF